MDWKLIYREDGALLYARSDSPASKIEGAPIVGKAPQFSFP
jgi:hypothetical protein